NRSRQLVEAGITCRVEGKRPHAFSRQLDWIKLQGACQLELRFAVEVTLDKPHCSHFASVTAVEPVEVLPIVGDGRTQHESRSGNRLDQTVAPGSAVFCLHFDAKLGLAIDQGAEFSEKRQLHVELREPGAGRRW